MTILQQVCFNAAGGETGLATSELGSQPSHRILKKCWNDLFVPHFSKSTRIKKPASVDLIVFLDVHEGEILDTMFGIPVETDWSQDCWFDIPGNRHNQGCPLSFGDGHVEHWRWKAPKRVPVLRGSIQSVANDEWDDYNRMEAGFRQNFD
jgi:prepilin-type processing-associated H-X9-DG protein